jgi:hypothetical protein
MHNWDAVLVDRLNRKFEEVATRGVIAAFQENLYVYHDLQHRSITLYAGSHPVGNSLQGPGLAIEEGAALTVSQAVDGSVAFVMYPFKSELMHRSEDKFLWGLFKGPDVVSWRAIEKAISDAARYWRVSSVLDGGSRFDRLCVDYLLLKARLREVISKRNWLAKMTKISVVLVGVISFLSAVATLAGTSIPQLWSQLHPSKNVGMPLVTGWYTFCPQDKTGASPKLLDLFHDIRQNAGKVAFFDVQVDVDCVMERPFDPVAAFSRKAGERSLTYSFNDGNLAQNTIGSSRLAARLDQLVPDNGAFITILDDRDGHNALTRLAINSEGVDDEVYGPYLIKTSSEDAALTLTLSAPTLDSTMQDMATAIALKRRAAHEKDPAPTGVPLAIPLSAAELSKLHDSTASPAAIAATGVPQPIKLPPLDKESLRRLPPIPTIPRMPHSAPLPDTSGNSR